MWDGVVGVQICAVLKYGLSASCFDSTRKPWWGEWMRVHVHDEIPFPAHLKPMITGCWGTKYWLKTADGRCTDINYFLQTGSTEKYLVMEVHGALKTPKAPKHPTRYLSQHILLATFSVLRCTVGWLGSPGFSWIHGQNFLGIFGGDFLRGNMKVNIDYW